MSEEKFECWAIVELMGHRSLAGKMSEQVIGGMSLLRVDVPEVPTGEGAATIPAFTQFYGLQTIYSLTPTSESVARLYAQERREQPIQKWDLPALPARASAVDGDDSGDPE